MRVSTTAWEDHEEREGDHGGTYMIDKIVMACARCGHEVASYGTSDASYRRCAALLREGCPNGEKNFYVA